MTDVQIIEVDSNGDHMIAQACVTGMMDVFALNSHITKLQSEKEALEVAAEQMRRETEDHDQERRGLLNLLEEKKTSLEQSEECLKIETNRRKVIDYNLVFIYLVVTA